MKLHEGLHRKARAAAVDYGGRQGIWFSKLADSSRETLKTHLSYTRE